MKRSVNLLSAFVLLIFTALLLPSALLGQGGEGNIVGHVKDSTGGVINGATITVTNPATGLKRTVQSDSDGTFSVINLAPGNYKIETIYAGFATSARDVTVLVSQSLDLNVELRPAGQQQQVNVEAVAPLVETTTATLHKAITISERKWFSASSNSPRWATSGWPNRNAAPKLNSCARPKTPFRWKDTSGR